MLSGAVVVALSWPPKSMGRLHDTVLVGCVLCAYGAPGRRACCCVTITKLPGWLGVTRLAGCRACCCMACLSDGRCTGSSVTRRKLQTPGTAEEDRKHLLPTQTTVNRHKLTDQATGTIERAARESRRITPISTAVVHAFSAATTRHHYPHPAGSSPDPVSQCIPLRSTGGLSRTTSQTPPASAGTPSAPHLGGPLSGVADGQPRAHGLPLRRGRGEGEGRG